MLNAWLWHAEHSSLLSIFHPRAAQGQESDHETDQETQQQTNQERAQIINLLNQQDMFAFEDFILGRETLYQEGGPSAGSNPDPLARCPLVGIPGCAPSTGHTLADMMTWRPRFGKMRHLLLYGTLSSWVWDGIFDEYA
jgi:hypothetical protein